MSAPATCPDCNRAIQSAPGRGQLICCPHCGAKGSALTAKPDVVRLPAGFDEQGIPPIPDLRMQRRKPMLPLLVAFGFCLLVAAYGVYQYPSRQVSPNRGTPKGTPFPGRLPLFMGDAELAPMPRLAPE